MFSTGKQVINILHTLILYASVSLALSATPLAFAQSAKIKEVRTTPAESYLLFKGRREELDAEILPHCKKVNSVFTDTVILREELNLLSANEFMVACIVALPSVQPRSIEKRLLQHRKFKKSPRELSEAIRTLFIGGNGPVNLPNVKAVGANYYFEDNGKGIMIQKATANGFDQTPGKYIQSFVLPLSMGQQIFLQFEIYADLPKPKADQTISFDVDKFASLIDVETIVKLQVSISNAGKGAGTIFDPTTYNKIFKRVADQLFVDAIELEVLEMQ